jgi:twinkle protein
MNWQKAGIDISKVRGGKMPCPNCSKDRKHKSDPCLSVDKEKGLYNCHHCGFSGCVSEYKKREFVKPLPRLEKVSDKTIKFFESRGISNNTILRFGITESREFMPQLNQEAPVICFNYIRDEQLVNIKFRGAKKSFKLSKDAELIFYNLDSIKEESTCVIVEGEIDCLSFHESGVYNVISVPNGATKGNQRLEYLDNCWRDFEGKGRIILATDSDEAGISLRNELVRRLGAHRCFQVFYPADCKDANDVLLKHGKMAVVSLIENAQPWPIEGIVSMPDMIDEVLSFYEHGYPEGVKAGIPGFDEHLSFYPGQLTVVTGIPGSGKSEFVDWLMASISKKHGWNWGICSFECIPPVHVTKIAEKFTDKSFGFRKDPGHRMTPDELEYALGMIDKHFHFINISLVDVTMDGLIAKAEELVKRKGINGLLFDPWNCIEHKYDGESETKYVLECLNKLINFLGKYNVHGFLVAHPTKLQKDPKTGKYAVPTMYNISGSAHFFNRTHNGLSVWRDFETGTVDVHVQKVKWSWLGKIGLCSFGFDTMKRKYEAI